MGDPKKTMPSKKPYTTPRLIVHGRVEQLTLKPLPPGFGTKPVGVGDALGMAPAPASKPDGISF